MYGTTPLTDGFGNITSAGHRDLQTELERLRTVERPAAQEQLRISRHDGSVAENPELLDIIEHLARIEQRIAAIGEQLATCQVVATANTDRAELGTRVVAMDVDSQVSMTFDLVGPLEANAELGRLSTESPIGAAVHGLQVGEVGTASTPRGPRRFQVVGVSLPDAVPAHID